MGHAVGAVSAIASLNFRANRSSAGFPNQLGGPPILGVVKGGRPNRWFSPKAAPWNTTARSWPDESGSPLIVAVGAARPPHPTPQ